MSDHHEDAAYATQAGAQLAASRGNAAQEDYMDGQRRVQALEAAIRTVGAAGDPKAVLEAAAQFADFLRPAQIIQCDGVPQDQVLGRYQ